MMKLLFSICLGSLLVYSIGRKKPPHRRPTPPGKS